MSNNKGLRRLSMPYINGENRDQIVILPESLDDYVSEDNPVRVVDAFVDKLDVIGMNFDRATPAHEGRPGYDPRDMLKLYIYGYLNKIRSSRKLQTECTRNVELMWLLSKLVPDFRCIADFRKDNAKSIKLVFREFVKVCDNLDLLSKELIAIDGSKFKAVNSKDRNFTHGKLDDRIKWIDEKLEVYLAELDYCDKNERDLSEHTKEELEQLIEELNAHKETYMQYLKEMNETGSTQKSITDPEAKLMKNNGKFDVCFNTQTAVDSKNHIIADFVVTDHCNDTGLLEEVAQGAKEVLGVDTIEIIADKGYRKKEDVLNCILNGDVPNVPTFDNQDCYTFEFNYKECDITEELKNSRDREDILKCLSAGVIPDILKNKNITIEIKELFRETKELVRETIELVVDIETGELLQEESWDFILDKETNTVNCPMGEILRQKSKNNGKTRYTNKKACKKCKRKCTSANYKEVDFRPNKHVVKSKYIPNMDILKTKTETIIEHTLIPMEKKSIMRFTPNYKSIKLRKSIVEHPFGTVKRWCDGSYLLVKGKTKATADLALSFLGYNIKRAINILGVEELLAGM